MGWLMAFFLVLVVVILLMTAGMIANTPQTRKPRARRQASTESAKIVANVFVKEPTDDEETIRQLHREATQRKKEKDLDGAIECLRKAQALMKLVRTEYPRAQWVRLPKFLEKAGRKEEARIEFEAVSQMSSKMDRDRYVEQLKRGRRAKMAVPYFILERGPRPTRCPLHGKNEGLVLPVDHEYWDLNPTRAHSDCACHIRGITKREYERLKLEGAQDPEAPHILDEAGRQTGRREDRRVPIKENPES